jgi:hypothetical protein
MRVKPPRVPPAAQVAFNSTQGPRVPPGTYTVRMTKGEHTYDTKVTVGLDRRATFNAADRQAQYDAALRVRDLFGEMSDLVAKISAVRAQIGADEAKLKDNAAAGKLLQATDDKADAIRKKIVATKEGGAITGEERLREHTDTLYGAIMSYDGKPSDYQIARIDALKKELQEVQTAFDAFQKNDLPKANDTLKGAKLDAIQVPSGAADGDEGSSAEAVKAYFNRFEQD